MATTLGWTFQTIGELPLDRVWWFYEHWKEQPPTHVLLAMFLEYGDSDSAPRERSSAGNFRVSDPGGALGPAQTESSLPPQARQFIEQMKADPRYKLIMERGAKGVGRG